jgi:hypothetical protein
MPAGGAAAGARLAPPKAEEAAPAPAPMSAPHGPPTDAPLSAPWAIAGAARCGLAQRAQCFEEVFRHRLGQVVHRRSDDSFEMFARHVGELGSKAVAQSLQVQ